MRRTALFSALLAALLTVTACSKATTPPAAQPSTPAAAPDGSILRKADGEVHHQTYKPEETVRTGEGYYTMDPASGQVDSWSLNQPQEPNKLFTVLFAASNDGAWIIARTKEAGYLIDRKSSAVYAFDRTKHELVAAAAGTLVFEETAAMTRGVQGFDFTFGPASGFAGTGKFIVLGGDLKQRSTFALEIAQDRRLALLSPDGAKLALSAGKLYLVDPATGNFTTHESDSGIGTITADPDGKSFALIPAPATDAPPFRYTWEGKQLTFVAGTASPTGGLSIAREWAGTFTPTLVVRDSATGAPAFRVLGADLCYGYGLQGNPWTADGSAALFHGRDALYFVSAAGEIRKADLFTGDGFHEPFPSPTEPGLFVDRVSQENSTWRLAVVDGSGKKVQSPVFVNQGMGLWPMGPLWHPGGSFVQLSFFYRGGTGAPCGDFRIPLAPAVQKAPFPDQLTLEVTGTGDCLNLRDSYSVTSKVITCLKDGTRVTVEPAQDHSTQIWGDSQQWARVRTADGTSGWASVEQNYLKWSR